MTTDPDRRRRRAVLVVAALVAVRVVAVAALIAVHAEGRETMLSGDIQRYDQIAGALGVPYRDFQVEYPPLTYALLRVLHFSDHTLSLAAVAVWSLAFDLGTAAVLGWMWRRRATIAYLVLGLPFVLEPFLYLRIDLLSVFLAACGLAFVKRRYDLAAGFSLSLAVLAKIWPFSLLPLLLVERRWRALVTSALVGVALVGMWWGQAGSAGVSQVVSFRDATGWQVESIPGILWHIRDPSRVKYESGAWRTGVMPLWARPSFTALSLAAVAAAWFLAWRRRRDPHAGERAVEEAVYGQAPLAAVAGLLVFAPILSPQYVSWLLPAAAIVVAFGDRTVAWLTFAVTAVTAFTFVMLGQQPDGLLLATLPVLVRNLLLIALLVVVMVRLAAPPRRALPSDGDDDHDAEPATTDRAVLTTSPVA